MASMDTLSGGSIEPRGLEEEMRSSYLDYAMSVIVGRALPDVRDGLKPVHRRVLFAMHESGLQPNRPYRKCANVVGGVMGNFHPHGDHAIYDTLVRLAQDFAQRYPLDDGRVGGQARAHIEPLRQSKEAIIVTELPYQVTKGDGRNEGTGLIKKIAEVVNDKKIPEISDLRDESDKSGIRVVIELKRDVNPRVVLNKLYKHTPMQSTFGVNMVALVDGVPRTLGLEAMIRWYVDHQREVIVRRTFGDERRTEITASEEDIDVEDLIADQQMVIAITNSGYIKSLPLDTYRKQKRGGVGVTGMDMKDDDYIEHLFVTSTHDFLLFFTNRGKVYRQKVYELPEASRTARGRALVNLLPLREGEYVQAVLSTRDFSEGKYLVFATRKGMVKKTDFASYNTPIKADGIIAIKVRDDDELVAVRRTSGDDDVLMVSRAGQAVRFHESDVRSMGRDTTGVSGMNVSSPGNFVLAMDVARDEQDLLVVTDAGFGKRTGIDQFRKTKRGAMGVRAIKAATHKGDLAGALVVREH